MTDEEITNTDENHDRTSTINITSEENRTRAQAAPRAHHYAEQTTSKQDHEPRTKRSRARTRASHRGITIRRCEPASGRPDEHPATAPTRVDLRGDAKSIYRRWSGC